MRNNNLQKPGPVTIATTGTWDDQTFGLNGGPGTNSNHAKIGVSTSGTAHFTIFGDLNQQGTTTGKNCASSQNGRGGLFYIINDTKLWESVSSLMTGKTAPTKAPASTTATTKQKE